MFFLASNDQKKHGWTAFVLLQKKNLNPVKLLEDIEMLECFGFSGQIIFIGSLQQNCK